MAETLEVISVEDSLQHSVSLCSTSTKVVQSTSRSWMRRVFLLAVPLCLVGAAVGVGMVGNRLSKSEKQTTSTHSSLLAKTKKGEKKKKQTTSNHSSFLAKTKKGEKKKEVEEIGQFILGAKRHYRAESEKDNEEAIRAVACSSEPPVNVVPTIHEDNEDATSSVVESFVSPSASEDSKRKSKKVGKNAKDKKRQNKLLTLLSCFVSRAQHLADSDDVPYQPAAQ